jgi:hyperosmotically inducible periplasmic protein
MKNELLLLSAIGFSLLACDRPDQPNTPPSVPKNPVSYDADNTGVNVRDRNSDVVTPGNQSDSNADLTITQNVRKAVIADKNLSTDAKNVKIVTVSGVVTLRGPVASDAEKAQIEKYAKDVKGVNRVVNQIDVVRGR